MINPLPKWVDYGLMPLINVTVAFLISGLVVLFVGESPLEAAYLLVKGAFGSGYNLGFTLFYATTFMFTGLAVAVAFHAALFNIGGEGQAYIGGLGVGLVALSLDGTLPWWLTFPLAIIGAALFGAFWAFIPAFLQAKRGSHIVITTIMFNFIAAAVMVYLLSGPLQKSAQLGPRSRDFAEGAQLPKLGGLFEPFGLDMGASPLNITFLLALLMAFLVWVLIWRTRFGYEMRTLGSSPKAAIYAGMPEAKIIIVTMMISGGLAGMMALNPVMGDQARLQLDFVEGAGFVGIAVALMGRSHPAGIVPAAILFGALYQGGAELSFDMPNITRDMILLIQGLVILFAGAMENLFRPGLSRAFSSLSTTKSQDVLPEAGE
ncbi:ABC transporter permease [Pseudahrensia aquimaris]|uniref:ABC transporter permease n=1 Tax=Pseudahrensia aquimaris TaxID=744461 RepID=A0ABW3FE82_9HYPH